MFKLALLAAVLCCGCTTVTDHSDRPATGGDVDRAVASNPAAPGFDLAGSDERAIAIADRVMAAMGGRDAWDRTRYLSWTFFGRRAHVWDRATGDVRIEHLNAVGGEPTIVLMNVRTRAGRVFHGTEELEDPGLVDQQLEAGYRAWINDSYWLLMPFKLKDTGVTLRWIREDVTTAGRVADVLELTFDGVGVTPENKYEVHVVRESDLVEQWSFFGSRDDDQPSFSTPWAAWHPCGSILLSGDRGAIGSLTDIAVLEDLPASVFHAPEPVERPPPAPPEPAR